MRGISSRLDHYAEKKELDKTNPLEALRGHKKEHKYKPSSINLFPTIGIHPIKQTYTTQNVQHLETVKDRIDDEFNDKKYYNHRPNEIKNYKN